MSSPKHPTSQINSLIGSFEDAPSFAQQPWSKRRVLLAKKVASRGPVGLAVNIKYALKTNTLEPESRDLDRFISEGYATMSQKTGQPRLRPYSRTTGKQHKTVRLTNRGWLLLTAVTEK